MVTQSQKVVPPKNTPLDWIRDAFKSRFHMSYAAMENGRCACSSCEGRRQNLTVGPAKNSDSRDYDGLYGKAFDQSLELGPEEEGWNGLQARDR